MDTQERAALIHRLTRHAKANPTGYRARVAAFSVLGYATYAALGAGALCPVVALVVLAFWAPSGPIATLAALLAVPALLLAWVVLRALKVFVPHPEGVALNPQRSPELFALIGALRHTLGVPKLSRVLLTDEFNVATTQRPKLGLLVTESSLILGLPLLQALSKQDFTAVLAHELGHLSRNRNRLSGWVYRVVESYGQVAAVHREGRILDRLLSWYAPRLDLLSFPLRRQNEYEADAASATIVGNARAAQALVNVHVRAAVEGPFRKSVRDRVAELERPPSDLFLDWERQVRTQTAESAELSLKLALNETTSLVDTHPALRDRLARLGAPAALESLSEAAAARELLGPDYEALVEQVGEAWAREVSDSWGGEHARLSAAADRVRELQDKRGYRELGAAELYELADLSEDLHLDPDPLPAFRAVLAVAPDHESARLSVGRLLLERDDAEGVALVQAFEHADSPGMRAHVGDLLAGFFARTGNDVAAREGRDRASQARVILAELSEASQQLTSDDTFDSHDLTPEDVEEVQQALAEFPEIKCAYLVRKLAMGQFVFYVLALALRLSSRVTGRKGLEQRVVDALPLPGETWAIIIHDNKQFKAPLTRVSSSLIYES